MKNYSLFRFNLVALLFVCLSCDFDPENPKDTDDSSANINLTNYSKTPHFIKTHPGFNNLKIYSLLSSEDVLEDSPEFVYGSMADGCGLLKNFDGTFSLINNIEADYSIARITFDQTFKPVKGEYIVNSEATANTAQCSGSLITPQEHGFGPLYLSGGEWGGNSRNVFAINPYREVSQASSARILDVMGQWTIENAVVLAKDAYPDQTVVLIGDDSHGDAGGQLVMYHSETVGDLQNGKLYALKMVDEELTDNDLVGGLDYEIEFVELNERTYQELNLECINKQIMAFNRVEDIDYRKGSGQNNREVYFNATGRSQYNDSRTKYGRVYRLILDQNSPLKGSIRIELNGDDLKGKAKAFHSPDNILATENYLYIQEDPNGYDNHPVKEHDAYLYQYNLKTKQLKVVLESDHRSEEAISKGYSNADDRWGKWELTGMIDVSDVLGVDNTFLLIQQAHSWKRDAFLNPDGAGSDLDSSNEGSILTLIQGLER